MSLVLTMTKTFGEWLYEKRKGAKLTQQELADRVECTKGYISQLERDATHSVSGGPLRPSVEMVDSFAMHLGANLNEARLAAGYAPEPSALEAISRVAEQHGASATSFVPGDPRMDELYEAARKFARLMEDIKQNPPEPKP